MVRNFNYIKNEVVNSNLCSRCGACVGICPKQVITFKSNVNYEPTWSSEEDCINCGLCIDVCPAKGYSLQADNKNINDISGNLGKFIDVYKGKALDNYINLNATSGGIVTAVLIYLLKCKEVEKVVVVENTEDSKDGYAKVTVTSDIKTILNSMQSKYIQLPVGKVINEIRSKKENIAIVGLPCQLAAIDKASQKLPVIKSRIKFKIGLFCGFTYTQDSVADMLKIMEVKEINLKRIVGWRNGGLPGNFTVELNDGTIKALPFIKEHSINVTFNALNRCGLCKDCFAEYADISLGDIGGWRTKETLIVSRTDKAEQILAEMVKNNLIRIKSIRDSKYLKKTVIPFMIKEKIIKTQIRNKYLKSKNITNVEWEYRKGTISKILKIESILLYRLSLLLRNSKVKRKIFKNKYMAIVVGELIYYRLSKNILVRAMKKLEKKFLKDEDVLL